MSLHHPSLYKARLSLADSSAKVLILPRPRPPTLCRKRTVNSVATFDFCADLVADVPDPIGDEDEQPKKKRAPRKKKAAEAGDEADEMDEDKVKPEGDSDEDEEDE